MTAVEDARQRAGWLCDQARTVTLRALEVQAQTRVLAEATAATEEQVAATLDQLARQQPHRAGQLQAMGESARRYAARERQRLLHPPGGGTRRGHDPATAASRPARSPASMPEPAAITRTPDRVDNLSIVEERDRIAAELRDTIICRVFAAGLSLQSSCFSCVSPSSSQLPSISVADRTLMARRPIIRALRFRCR